LSREKEKEKEKEKGEIFKYNGDVPYMNKDPA
jgi:hypothetical protein